MLQKLKMNIKKYKSVQNSYLKILELMYVLPFIPNELPTKIFYSSSTGKKLNLKAPKSFNEKLQWIKLYHRDPLYTLCADKFKVREYVEDKGFGDILNKLYGIYDSVDDIKFGELPNSFVVKGTKNGHIICNDISNIDINAEIKLFKKELKKNFGMSTGEFHYTKIKQRVIVEEYLGFPNGELPLDYKIYCFNGEPFCICVYERDATDFSTRRFFYDFDWNPLPEYITGVFASDPNRYKKPKNLDSMYNIAKGLSEDFPFVRVDLYNLNGKIYFGELTFTPTSGIGKAYTEKALQIFGEKIKLPV
ncbi:ATP-grasp fold amidoligase family protein [Aerococcus viridans]|uniref:ATP-grasp fold amidoligase family protein n=1 Tax=Aerococcus viridans TaxID=1377 RepID=UPI003B214C9B